MAGLLGGDAGRRSFQNRNLPRGIGQQLSLPEDPEGPAQGELFGQSDRGQKNFRNFVFTLAAMALGGSFGGGGGEGASVGGEGGSGFFANNFGDFSSVQGGLNSAGNIQSVGGLLGGGQQPQQNNAAQMEQARQAQIRGLLGQRRPIGG